MEDHQSKRPRLELEDEDELWGPDMTAEEVDTIQTQVSTIESQFSISYNIPIGGSSKPQQSFGASNGDEEFLQALEGQVKMMTSEIQKERKDKDELQKRHQVEVKQLQNTLASLQGQLQFKDQEMKRNNQKLHVLEQKIKTLQQKSPPSKTPWEHPLSTTSSGGFSKQIGSSRNSFVTTASAASSVQSTSIKTVCELRPRKGRDKVAIAVKTTLGPGLNFSEDVVPIHQLAHHLAVETLPDRTVSLLSQILNLLQSTPACTQDEHCSLNPLLECSSTSPSKLHHFLMQPLRHTEMGKDEESSILLKKYLVLHAAYFHSPSRFSSRLELVDMLKEASGGSKAVVSIALELCLHLLPRETQPAPGLYPQLCSLLEKNRDMLNPVTLLLTTMVTRYGVTPLIHKDGFPALLTRFLSLLGASAAEFKSRVLEEGEAVGSLGALEPGLILMTHVTFFLPHYRWGLDPSLSSLLWTMATLGVHYSAANLAYALFSMTSYDPVLSVELKNISPSNTPSPS